MSQPDGLSHLVEEGIIDVVHARLMSGKEATVYVVEREGHLGAAKVYKARDERTFKKTASYVEGRNQTRNSRDRRAMQKKSAYGRGLIEDNWQEMEFHALRAAFDAGVRVPEPYFLYENVLFMELVVDGAGTPASRLADFTFTAEEATALHQEVFLQVKALLGTGRIHGDLSAYNVLMAAAGPTIIDLPQVVEVAGNNNARQILRRDLRNLTEHLARFDARLLRVADCGDALFQHLQRGTLDSVTVPEVGMPEHRSGGGGGGRRGRDAERGRAGRDKGHRPGGGAPMARPGGGPPHQQRPGAPSPQSRPGAPSSQSRPGARSPQAELAVGAGGHRSDQSRGYAGNGGAPRVGVAANTGEPSPTSARHRRRRRGGR